MKTLENMVDGGLVVVRSGIDRAFANDLMQELLEEVPAHRRELANDNPLGSKVLSFGLHGDNPGTYTASQKLLETLDFYPRSITVNYQPPLARQKFHKDNPCVSDTVTIVHCADEGAFDYAVNARSAEEAENLHETIELSAGDIVFQSRPYIFHRGRNMGNQPRITVALAEPVDDDWGGSR